MVSISTISDFPRSCHLSSSCPPETSLRQHKHVAFKNEGTAYSGINLEIRVREYGSANWNSVCIWNVTATANID